MNYYLLGLFSDLNNLPDVVVKLLDLSIIFFSLYRLIFFVLMKSKENSFLETEVN